MDFNIQRKPAFNDFDDQMKFFGLILQDNIIYFANSLAP